MLQQTPSTQLPLSHWAPEVQVAWFPFLPHEWLVQLFGLTHWLSVSQLVRHSPVVLSQVKAPQLTVVWDGQASPLPSQNAGASELVALEHEGAAHWLLVWYTSQAPFRQVPFVPQVLTFLVAHCLSAVPFATAEQRPGDDDRLQA